NTFFNEFIRVDLIEANGQADHLDVGAGSLLIFVGPDNPTLTAAGPAAVSINEGSSYTLAFNNIQNVGRTSEILGVIVYWGDGNYSIVYGDPSQQSVSHTYVDGMPAGTQYNVTADLYEYYSFHPSIVTKTVTVNDVAPTISVFSITPIAQGEFNFAFL